jgi:hypothetical protein
MGEGAERIWNLTAQHFLGAMQILDLYHARQHLWEVARALHPHDEVKQKAWMKIHQKRLLDKGKIAKLVGLLRPLLFAGSGVIEAGCETVIASRFKRSGMFWTVRGANAILALRCRHLNGRFEDYWDRHAQAVAA